MQQWQHIPVGPVGAGAPVVPVAPPVPVVVTSDVTIAEQLGVEHSHCVWHEQVGATSAVEWSRWDNNETHDALTIAGSGRLWCCSCCGNPCLVAPALFLLITPAQSCCPVRPGALCVARSSALGASLVLFAWLYSSALLALSLEASTQTFLGQAGTATRKTSWRKVKVCLKIGGGDIPHINAESIAGEQTSTSGVVARWRSLQWVHIQVDDDEQRTSCKTNWVLMANSYQAPWTPYHTWWRANGRLKPNLYYNLYYKPETHWFTRSDLSGLIWSFRVSKTQVFLRHIRPRLRPQNCNIKDHWNYNMLL